jgi:hypothetical protein
MADETGKKLSLEELMVSTLAMTDDRKKRVYPRRV